MDLNEQNPWWRHVALSESLLGIRRNIFHEVEEYLEIRQMLLLVGLRRTGKTTLIYQLIQRLLEKEVSPSRILYWSFDDNSASPQNLLDEFCELFSHNLDEGGYYFFLDEIQKLPNWQNQIKLYYDRYPQFKFILSGSAQINLEHQSSESLAGRFFKFHIKPLDFSEYLVFQKASIDLEQEDLYESEIKKEFQNYLATGGFIETLGFNDKMRQLYIKDSLLDIVIYRDLSQVFKIQYPALLGQLMKIAAGQVGIYSDYKNLGSDLGVDHRTVQQYLQYLEYALIMQKVYNYSSNVLKSEKALKRFYLKNSAFTLILNPNVSFADLLEQYFINWLESEFFFRSPQKEEVDLVLEQEDRLLPIEIKIRSHLKKKDYQPLMSFMKKYQVRQGLMISKQHEHQVKEEGQSIHVIPYWKTRTIQRYLNSN